MKKKGFTFIELLIVIGIISISLPLVFGLLFINLKSQSKVYILNEVKRNGDFAVNTIGFLLRQYGQRVTDVSFSTDVCPILPNPELNLSDQVNVIDTFGKGFSLFFDDDKIASASPDSPIGNGISTQYLTNDKVKIQNLDFSCYRPTAFDKPIISVSFSVSQAGETQRHEEKATLNYATKIKLRN